MLGKIIENFCNSTNIHGFAYTVQTATFKIEKYFWVFSILISFILTGILIHKLVIEGQKNPTIIYTDQNVISVQELNFPAVSLCLNLIYKTSCKTIIDYGSIKQQLQEQQIKIDNLTLEQLKLMQVVSLVARDGFISENYPLLKIPTDDFMDKLELFSNDFPNGHMYSSFVSGHWLQQYSITLTRVLARNGFCYTFNLPDIIDIYRRNSNFYNFSDTKVASAGSAFSLSSEIKEVVPDNPKKAKNPGSGLYMIIRNDNYCIIRNGTETIPSKFYYSEFYIPESPIEGHALKIHDPYEIVTNTATTFHVDVNLLKVFVIIPQITRIDESLEEVVADERNCYLKNERNLKFFKVYNKVNCEHECLADKTLDLCNCVQFYMARNSSTKICGSLEERCFQKVEDDFDQVKSACKCYNPCENIEYEVKLKSIEFPFQRDLNHIFGDGSVKIEFGVESVFAINRKKSQTYFEFLSFVGGLLGLFTGFSVISGIEVIYYLIFLPIFETKLRNDTRVYPFEKNDQKESIQIGGAIRFIKEMFTSSSIHGFGQIGAEGRNPAERINWIITFITSMVLTYYMVQNIYIDYKETKIVMSLEGQPTKVEDLPFPAVTIIRDIEFAAHYYYEDNITSFNYHYEEGYYNQAMYDQLRSIMCTTINHNLLYVAYYAKPFKFKNVSDIVDLLRYYTYIQPNWTKSHSSSWNGYSAAPSAEILTSTIFGYTFNLIEESKLLNEKEISKDFRYSYGNISHINYPWKTSARNKAGLNINVDLSNVYNSNFDDSLYGPYCYTVDRFQINSPFELPLRVPQTTISIGYTHVVEITPEIVKVDDNLRSLDVNSRKCYFENERKLKFFKIYTQKNCEMECISFIVNQKCSCVPYNYLRNQSTRICDQYYVKNCSRTFDYFTDFSAFDYLFETEGVCQCLPSCSFVKYSYEVVRNRLTDEKEQFYTSIEVKWKEDEYFALVRYQQTRLNDLLSYVGGILGLFAGISVLSIFEIIYFFTLRLTTDLIRYFRN